MLDLDESVGINHIFAKTEHLSPSWQQSATQSYEQAKADMIPSQKEDLFTIQ